MLIPGAVLTLAEALLIIDGAISGRWNGAAHACGLTIGIPLFLGGLRRVRAPDSVPGEF